MESRVGILDNSFSDLDEEDRNNFVTYLLQTSKARLSILNDQLQINSNNLKLLNQELQKNKNIYSRHSHYPALLNAVKLVSNTSHLLKKDFATLKSFEERQQFIMGLFYLDANSRYLCMEDQFNRNTQNIIELSSLLMTSDEKSLAELKKHPLFLPLLKELFNFKRAISTINSTQNKQEIIEDKSEESEETARFDTLCFNITELKDEIFDDNVIQFDKITFPFITPQGTTYDLQAIYTQVETYHSDPCDRSPLKMTDLIFNNLFAHIQELFNAETINGNSLLQLLRCPLSDEIFVEPVIAEDENTYERVYLEAYLKKHNNKTPSGVTQTKPLYCHRFLLNFLEEERIQELIKEAELLQTKSLGNEVCEARNKLLQYKHDRVKENNFAGYACGYSKWEKLNAPTNLIRVLSKTLPVQTFFSPAYKNDLQALKQGRLKPIAESALEVAEKIFKPK